METNARVLLDSINIHGNRLITLEVTLWRAVLAEFNTHRVLTRNSGSSRAVPYKKQRQRVIDEPFIPLVWGVNQPGMIAGDELPPHLLDEAEKIWLEARDDAVRHADRLSTLGGVGVHKQHVNRLLEPFMWHTIICTATEWDNFDALRSHPEAQPEIRVAAERMIEAKRASEPTLLMEGEWHTPLMPDIDELHLIYPQEVLNKISAGRCARVSYLTHHGERDPQADIDLCERLYNNGHMSPLEHVATPAQMSHFIGNFRGWVQMRKLMPHEDNFGARLRLS